MYVYNCDKLIVKGEDSVSQSIQRIGRIASTTTMEMLMFMLITIILLPWMTYSRVRVDAYSRSLNFWLNEKCKENGWLKNEHVILLQVQCIHTASLFWHTHQAQWHPTHQLSSHVKFTQCADRQRSSHVCCVSLPVCASMHNVWVQVCTVRQCVCLSVWMWVWDSMCIVSLRMSRMDITLGEHHTQ